MKNFKRIFLTMLGFICFGSLVAQHPSLQIKDGKVNYLIDERGNRVLDYSYCGYKSSGQDIPVVKNVVFVPWKEGDNSLRIQKAIDYASSLKPDVEGFRGAVLLDKGTFVLENDLYLHTSGVVLRGMDSRETVLLKKGVDRGALLYIEGIDDRTFVDTIDISSAYVPVNNRWLEVNSGCSLLKKDDRVLIVRPSTKEWIASVACTEYGGGISALGWKPGDIDIWWDRTVTGVIDGKIEIDSPLSMALDSRYAHSKLVSYTWKGRIENVGVENMTLISDYDKRYPKDEDHCWTGISVENAENCWIRKLFFRHFSGSAVILQPTSSKITVEDCISTQPVSEIGGMRRCTFLTMGQLNLFQRCYSEHGIHDFSAGYCAAGPNAFVQCESYESFGFSGSIDSWACGLLFDIVNIDGHNLSYKNLGQDKNGAGWNTANSTFWQCTAAGIECFSPAEDAKNRAYGCWAQFSGDGEWAESNNHIEPRSLFYAQLNERLNKDCSLRARILPKELEATSSPTVELAMELAQKAFIPKLTLRHWIEQASVDEQLISVVQVKNIDELKITDPEEKNNILNRELKRVSIIDGRLVMGGELLVGKKLDVPWWSGKLRTSYLAKSLPHITRFVPGREGLGVTDRIDSVINYMKVNNYLVIDHNYGLWYDRRRDDHERVRRLNGDVWGPFYEQPFKRSGQGTAWEGLSKYDLTQPNAWYWARLKEFAGKAEQEGLLLFHENYFQHNILEAGAHWVDCPWRTVNNINRTDFPEPVPFAGDKRIFMAEMFYDINHPVRRELHRQYIRKCLDNFADCSNVVQLISAEFTGPLHFVQFWLDEIAAWEKETGKHALVALSTTKDVQDAILTDAKRASVVDIIDIRYWHYKTDGIYAPGGGKNMAPRQHMRKMKAGKITFSEAYKAVEEYRTKYPDKAVTYYAQNYPAMAWAVLMAGGSCPSIFVHDETFLSDVAKMKVEKTDTDTYKKLVKSDTGAIVYSQSPGEISVFVDDGKYSLKYIDPSSGTVEVLNKSFKISGLYVLKIPEGKEGVYWIHKLK